MNDKDILDNVFVYKIHDTDLEEYSQYLVATKECAEIIDEAVGLWYDNDCDVVGCDNMFECIDMKLDKNHISYKWFKFDDDNTINF